MDDFLSQNIKEDKTAVVSLKNKKIALIWLVAPLIGFLLTVLFLSIISFISKNILSKESLLIIFDRVNLFLGLLAILFTIANTAGLFIAIYYINKKKLDDNYVYDKRSGEWNKSIVPSEIKGWNWGAAGLSYIWGIYHKVWFSLLIFIPFLNIITVIILGIKGNEWAWKSQKWESVDSFIESQKKWKPWGIFSLIFIIILLILKVKYNL